MGYMGHLTLISEDIVTAFKHYPPDLLDALKDFVPQPEWDEYVSGSYRETKNKDTSLLGGGRPVLRNELASELSEAIDLSSSIGASSSHMPEGGLRTIVLTGDDDSDMQDDEMGDNNTHSQVNTFLPQSIS